MVPWQWACCRNPSEERTQQRETVPAHVCNYDAHDTYQCYELHLLSHTARARTHTHTHTHTHHNISQNRPPCSQTHTQTHAYTYTHRYAHTHSHTHTHTHTYTYTHTVLCKSFRLVRIKCYKLRTL